LNLRPLLPQSSALPSCATPRCDALQAYHKTPSRNRILIFSSLKHLHHLDNPQNFFRCLHRPTPLPSTPRQQNKAELIRIRIPPHLHPKPIAGRFTGDRLFLHQVRSHLLYRFAELLRKAAKVIEFRLGQFDRPIIRTQQGLKWSYIWLPSYTPSWT
jgi:hypothetical protein